MTPEQHFFQTLSVQLLTVPDVLPFRVEFAACKNDQLIGEISAKVDHVKSLTRCSNTNERIKTNAEDIQ